MKHKYTHSQHAFASAVLLSQRFLLERLTPHLLCQKRIVFLNSNKEAKGRPELDEDRLQPAQGHNT